MFDSQVAAMALGLGDSIAYDALVKALLKRPIDKGPRFTDWSRRPLSDAQLEYAMADVTHLRDLYPIMQERLEKKGRAEWLAEEMKILTNPETYRLDPEESWRRMKLRKNSPKWLAALRAAAAWRETEAQTRDMPRQRVMKDDAIYEIAGVAPTSPEQLTGLRFRGEGLGRSPDHALLQRFEPRIPGTAAIGIERQARRWQQDVVPVDMHQIAQGVIETLDETARQLRHGEEDELAQRTAQPALETRRRAFRVIGVRDGRGAQCVEADVILDVPAGKVEAAGRCAQMIADRLVPAGFGCTFRPGLAQKLCHRACRVAKHETGVFAAAAADDQTAARTGKLLRRTVDILKRAINWQIAEIANKLVFIAVDKTHAAIPCDPSRPR